MKHILIHPDDLDSVDLRDARVIFLHDDYQELLALEKQHDIKVHQLGHLFHDTEKEIEAKYIRLFDSLADKYDQLQWHSSHLGSKSATSTPLFRDVIYLFAALKLMRGGAEKFDTARFVFVIKKNALAQAIATAAEKKLYDVENRYRKRLYDFWTFKLFRCIAKLKVFGIRRLSYMCLGLFARKPELRKDGERLVLLRSWVTKGCLSDDGKFQERNFGRLNEWYVKNGYTPVYYPMFFNLGEPYRKTVQKIAKLEQKFIVPEFYISLFDIYRLGFAAFFQFFWRFDDVKFMGLQIEPLLADTNRDFAGNIDLLKHNLSYYALKNLRRRGVQFVQAVYPFENNALEKTLLLALKKFHPKTEVVGYQHSMWYQEQPSMKISSPEKQPLPDRIICSGHVYPSVLNNCGFPNNIIELGPSLRFDFSKVEGRNPQKMANLKPNVLIVLNYETGQAVEVLLKYAEASRKLDLTTRVKSHPLNHQAAIKAAVAKIDDCEIIEAAVPELIDQTDIVIVQGASVTMLESVIRCKPTIRVSPSNSFFLDPLWHSYPINTCIDTTDIGQALGRAIEICNSSMDQLKKVAIRTRNNYFEPVTEESLNVFTPGGPGGAAEKVRSGIEPGTNSARKETTEPSRTP